MNWLIFTDLDGTLLNHDNYKSDAAHAMIDELKARDIPIVFVTSKTRAEVEKLQAELAIFDPFIVENGAAIFIPEGYRDFDLNALPLRDGYRVLELGTPYAEIRAFLEQMQPRYSVRGFGDMSEHEVAALIDLPHHRARDAMAREYTEPFVIHDATHEPAIHAEVGGSTFSVTRGGRFHHLMGEAQDKGRAVETLIEIFRNNGYAARTVSLGDSRNDIPMFEVTDVAILIPKLDGSYEPIELPNLVKARAPGARGWAAALREVIGESED